MNTSEDEEKKNKEQKLNYQAISRHLPLTTLQNSKPVIVTKELMNGQSINLITPYSAHYTKHKITYIYFTVAVSQ